MSSNLDLPPHYRRNFLAFMGDFLSFGVGMNFISQTAVLPSLVRELTDSAPLIGLVSTLQTGGWLLPQLFAASYVASKLRKKPYIVVPALVGRSTYPLLALAIWGLAGPYPNLVLILLFLAIVFFSLCDGLASVPWFDLFSKSVPATRRGRLIGLAQMISGVTGIGAGILVGYILGPRGPGFPHNYATLFAIASIFFAISFISITQIWEHPVTVVPERLPFRAFLSQLTGVMRTDATLRLLILVRLLIAWSSMAVPFYVIYALDVLGFDRGVVGVFVSAQVIGGIFSGMGMGYISERMGTRAVIRLAGVMAVAAPLWALGLSLLRSTLPAEPLLYLYAVIFAVLGALNNAMMAGFMSYILEIAPTSSRPLYVGLANTLGSLVLLAPIIGGWILQATSSYTVLLTATSLTCLAGLVGAWRLIEPRHHLTVPLAQAVEPS
jgi:MFS family permease